MKPKLSTPTFPRLFSYAFALAFFLAGVAAGLGRGQISVNDLWAVDQRAMAEQAAAFNSAYWAGAYSMCMAYNQNYLGAPRDGSIKACNHAIADGVTYGVEGDPYYNGGFVDPFK
jgi:hypothetical protein